MQLRVTSRSGYEHRVSIRRHELVVDQPIADGGRDAGPTPVELFVASLASCVAHYAGRALASGSDGPVVECSWTMSDTPPWRVASIDVDVMLPAVTPEARVAAARRAVEHCTVHNTLVDLPLIRIRTGVPAGV